MTALDALLIGLGALTLSILATAALLVILHGADEADDDN